MPIIWVNDCKQEMNIVHDKYACTSFTNVNECKQTNPLRLGFFHNIYDGNSIMGPTYKTQAAKNDDNTILSSLNEIFTPIVVVANGRFRIFVWMVRIIIK